MHTHGSHYTQRTRSKSKDDIDNSILGFIASDVSYNTHHSYVHNHNQKHNNYNNPLYPLPMTQDPISGNWNRNHNHIIPPPPPKHSHGKKHRKQAASVAITRSSPNASPNYKPMMAMDSASDKEDTPGFKLLNVDGRRLKNDHKYKTMGPMMFAAAAAVNNNNNSEHIPQYSNSSISSIASTSHDHSHGISHIPHAYSNSLPSNTTTTVLLHRHIHHKIVMLIKYTNASICDTTNAKYT